MTRFFNEPGTIVTDAIDGALARRGNVPLARLNGYPHIRVVHRTDLDGRRVAVISGGGSGHEPAHAGFVGHGMLTAAVAGEVFASPSVDAVLAGIRAVTGEAGALLVVKNYTGDRLNFGLAAERAKQLGLAVEMVIVSDDIALPDAPQPRGLAGTLFVHKVAGHLAEEGADLATVKAAAEATARAARSIGLSLSGCDLPGQPRRSHEDTPELGLGIHGEPGAERVDLKGARHAVGLLVERLIAGDPEPEADLAVLVNNLGGVTPLEMGVLTRELVTSPLGDRIRLLIGPAPLMTSLNMCGFSLSTLPLTPEREAALSAPVAPEAWPAAVGVGAPEIHPLPPALAASAEPPSADAHTEALLRRACDALVAGEAELNELDSRVGDGDTGSTFAAAARAVLAELDSDALPLADPRALLRALGRILSNSMGGSSGVLGSILFTTAGNAEGPLGEALTRGAEAVQRYGGATVGDRTMLDALMPALEALRSGQDLSTAAAAADAGAEATGDIQQAGAGRSAYLRADSLHGVPDPGAVAVARVLRAIAAR